MAWRRPRTVLVTGALALTALALALAVHLTRDLRRADLPVLHSRGHASLLASPWLLWAPIAGTLIIQTLRYHLERPIRAPHEARSALTDLTLAVLIPVSNEDAEHLRATLASLLRRTRPPAQVHLVDDGSVTDYTAVQAWSQNAASAAGINTGWQRTDNRGKRHAQATAFGQAGNPDLLVTIDSDACLAPDALAEALEPFADPRVQAVAGVVLAADNRVNLLSRITDLLFVSSQLVDRSALTRLGAVMVASGSLAVYRTGVLRENLETYLGETFFGRPVVFSAMPHRLGSPAGAPPGAPASTAQNTSPPPPPHPHHHGPDDRGNGPIPDEDRAAGRVGRRARRERA